MEMPTGLYFRFLFASSLLRNFIRMYDLWLLSNRTDCHFLRACAWKKQSVFACCGDAWGSKGIAALFPNLGSGWRWVVRPFIVGRMPVSFVCVREREREKRFVRCATLSPVSSVCKSPSLQNDVLFETVPTISWRFCLSQALPKHTVSLFYLTTVGKHLPPCVWVIECVGYDNTLHYIQEVTNELPDKIMTHLDYSSFRNLF
jgi:hypothetical protein